MVVLVLAEEAAFTAAAAAAYLCAMARAVAAIYPGGKVDRRVRREQRQAASSKCCHVTAPVFLVAVGIGRPLAAV